MKKLIQTLEQMNDVLDDTLVAVRYTSEIERYRRIITVRNLKRWFRPSIEVDSVRFLDDAIIKHEYILKP